METIVKSRDDMLDRLRGFAMLWVILVHTLFWGKLFENGYASLIKSFFLFEMPLFFFVTGAGNSMGKEYTYGRFVAKRFERCLIPYWIFAFICATISAVKCLILNKTLLPILKTCVSLFIIPIIYISWSLPIDFQITPINYLTWALWFIPVYLCVVLLIPLFLKIRNTKFSAVFFVLLNAVFLVSAIFKAGWIQNVLFYSVWTYIGFYYQSIKCAEKKRRNVLIAGITLLVSFGALFILYKAGLGMNMQVNKFPPNTVFYFFSFAAVSVLYLIYPVIDLILKKISKFKLTRKMFDVFCTKSMTVFLYQVFAFIITFKLISYISTGNTFLTDICKLIVCFPVSFFLCGLLGMICGKIESLSVISLINKHKIE